MKNKFINIDEFNHVLIKNFHNDLPLSILETSLLISLPSLPNTDQLIIDAILKHFIGEKSPSHYSEDIWLPNQDYKNELVGYKIEDTKSIIKFTQYAPVHLKQKLIFIPQAHQLSITLQNKLLKVVEETPVHCCFYFLTNKKNTLLTTLKSRLKTWDTNQQFNTQQINRWFNQISFNDISFENFKMYLKDPLFTELLHRRVFNYLNENPTLSAVDQWLNLSKTQFDKKNKAILPSTHSLGLYHFIQNYSL